MDINALVKAVTDMAASVEQINAEIADLESKRDSIVLRLSQIQDAIGLPKAESAAPTRAIRRQRPRVTEVEPAHKALAKFVAGAEIPFTAIDAIRALHPIPRRIVGWHIDGMVARGELIRVEGNRFDKPAQRPNPPSMPEQHDAPAPDREHRPPAPGTIIAKLVAWPDTVQGPFSFTDAVNGTDVGKNAASPQIGRCVKRGFWRKLGRGQYERVRPMANGACP